MSNTPHLLAGINWVDIVAFIIFLRVIFMGLKNGVATEAFKVVGTIIAVYVSLHYYRTISAFIGNKYILDARILEGCVFAVLACMAYAAIGIIRLVVGRLVNMTVVPAISRWGGCLLAILRAFLMTSLLFYFFMATNNTYLQKSVKASISGTGLVYFAPSVYGLLWNSVMSKLAPQETFNNAVFEITRDKTYKK